MRARGDGPVRYVEQALMNVGCVRADLPLTNQSWTHTQTTTGVESQKKVRAMTTYETCYATAGDDMTSMLRFQVRDWSRDKPCACPCSLDSLSNHAIRSINHSINQSHAPTATGPDGGARRAGALRRAAPEAQAPDAVRAAAAAAGQLQWHLMGRRWM